MCKLDLATEVIIGKEREDEEKQFLFMKKLSKWWITKYGQDHDTQNINCLMNNIDLLELNL
jgi:hypothetical protein